MPYLKHIPSDTIYITSEQPTWASGMWECGDQRFTDASGDIYAVQPDPDYLALLRADIWECIKAERTRRNDGGVLIGGFWFYTDAETRSQLSIMLGRALSLGLSDAYVFVQAWRTMTGAYTPMTLGLVKSIIDAGMASTGANFANSQAHRAALYADPDPENYDFSLGWSAIYEP